MPNNLDRSNFLDTDKFNMNLLNILSRIEKSNAPADDTFGGIPKDVVQDLPKDFVKFWKGQAFREHRKLPKGDGPVVVSISGGSRGRDGSSLNDELDAAGVKDYLRFRHSDINGIMDFFRKNKTDRPIRIIGHSWGGGMANKLAKRLAKHNNIASVDLIDPVSVDRGADVFDGAKIYAPKFSPLNLMEKAKRSTLGRVGLWRDDESPDVTVYRGGHSDIKEAIRKIVEERRLSPELGKAAESAYYRGFISKCAEYGVDPSILAALR